VFFLNGQFVAASNKAPGVFFSSADGANWTRKSTGLSKLLVSMAYGNGRLLATAQDGSLCTVEVGPLPPDELRRPRPDIDPWSAASLVLRTLLREDVTTEIRALILAEVQPDALIQTEHIDIMAAAQRINRRRGEINFASLDAELAEHAFGCFSRDIMRNVYEDRQSGPIQLEEVKDLIWILRRPFG
jgi:hypothetical protein